MNLVGVSAAEMIPRRESDRGKPLEFRKENILLFSPDGVPSLSQTHVAQAD